MIARYAGTVAVVALSVVLAVWLLRGRLDPGTADGGMLGAGLAAVGAVSGMLLTAWGFERDQKRFLAALALGILGRLAVYGAVLVYVALRTPIDPLATAAALLGCYVLFQVVEVRFVLRGLKGRKR
ncbi:MAG: hypothetical protein ACE5JH_11485 [Acidobacteriota bacterium]